MKFTVVLSLGLVLSPPWALAQTPASPAAPSVVVYPTKPIKIIVPFAAGGVTDIMARIVGNEMSKDMGQAVIVENVTGVSGVIGSQQLAKSAADGYTLMINSNVHTINPALRKTLPYDTLKDFAPLVLLGTAPNMLIVNAQVPVKTLAEYIALAKQKPGEVTYATAGVGTSLHIAGAQFSQITGTSYNHIPYAASNQSIQAVVAGHTISSWSAVNSALPFIKDGRVRALAVASDARTAFAPDIPTFAELGVPGMRSETWIGAFAPANTPMAITTKLASEMKQILVRPATKEKILSAGAEPNGLELEKFAAQIKMEIDMYKQIVQLADIKAE